MLWDLSLSLTTCVSFFPVERQWGILGGICNCDYRPRIHISIPFTTIFQKAELCFSFSVAMLCFQLTLPKIKCKCQKQKQLLHTSCYTTHVQITRRQKFPQGKTVSISISFARTNDCFGHSTLRQGARDTCMGKGAECHTCPGIGNTIYSIPCWLCCFNTSLLQIFRCIEFTLLRIQLPFQEGFNPLQWLLNLICKSGCNFVQCTTASSQKALMSQKIKTEPSVL